MITETIHLISPKHESHKTYLITFLVCQFGCYLMDCLFILTERNGTDSRRRTCRIWSLYCICNVFALNRSFGDHRARRSGFVAQIASVVFGEQTTNHRLPNSSPICVEAINEMSKSWSRYITESIHDHLFVMGVRVCHADDRLGRVILLTLIIITEICALHLWWLNGHPFPTLSHYTVINNIVGQ